MKLIARATPGPMLELSIDVADDIFCPPSDFSDRTCGHHSRHSRHAHDVARQHGDLEVLIDPLQTSEQRLSDRSDRLAPAEVFFDAFADPLTDPVSLMPSRAPVDSAAAATLDVHRHVRGDAALTTVGHEVARVIGL